ncbi:tripartite-type tricarboxylate transporter receptor subunit TctC [Pseudorhodoplanes sinuspersici]|uniref:ABC transporter substrate-binding protein n=2 Tax=Pseudorhodoplanes sinuspersici TaxID=1235591 RepID=A0A1W6ZTV8_9HYPH|nr:ABC transporter substrate-binding protein [Pseudorhodoplanes sinuspersici]RKE72345.1 tripartite-type tricarboxylate transporter receptor subunit TctC [Pseudorhodoplanes sinuspersici]
MGRLAQLFVVAAIAQMSIIGVAQSQANYPNRPIRLVVTFPPGGSTDTLARAMQPHLEKSLGQPIVIDNRPGAGGDIGVDAVAKAAPDGHTIGIGAAGALSVNISLKDKMPYDPQKDLAPITLLTAIPFVMVAGPGFQGKSLADVVKMAKAGEGKLAIGHGGNGTAMHLSSELFNHLTAAKIPLVPYKGSGPATQDVVAGHIPLAIVDVPSSQAMIKEGKIRVLGVTSLKRDSHLPDAPTFIEGGIKDYESIGWFGLIAPAGTPPDIIKKLNEAFVAAMNDPVVKERIYQGGAEARPTTPQEFGAFIKSETDKWGAIIKAAGVKLSN